MSTKERLIVWTRATRPWPSPRERVARVHTIALGALALLAACGGHERAVKPAGEGPNLEVAILTCNTERVKALVDEAPELIRDRANASGQYPLATAVQAARLCGPEIFRYLLDRDPDVNQAVVNNALLAAATRGDMEMVELLLQHGADPNAKRTLGTPSPYYLDPLQSALMARHLEIAQRLVSAGARPDACSAAALGRLALLRSLLRRDPEQANPPRRRVRMRPIECALMYRQRDAVRAILEYIPEPEFQDVVAGGDLSAVRNYLDHHPGAAAQPNDSGVYPLNAAVDAGDKDVVRLLLERGASVNSAAYLWDRPILHAIKQGDAEMVKFLIERGANVKTATFQAPLWEWPESRKHPEIAEMIRQAQ